MNFQISLTLLLAASVISFQDEDGGDFKIARKHYGLSFHSKCRDYFKSFTCMTTCKSIGFQIFRMDYRCKCSCHRLKTTTILPFFKWRTNGTTKTVPRTQSPNLYHVAGTLSPARTVTETTEVTTINVTCVPQEPTTLIASNNMTTNDESGNTTSVDSESSAIDAGGETTIADESDTGADGATSENMGDQTSDKSETGSTETEFNPTGPETDSNKTESNPTGPETDSTKTESNPTGPQ